MFFADTYSQKIRRVILHVLNVVSYIDADSVV